MDDFFERSNARSNYLNITTLPQVKIKGFRFERNTNFRLKVVN
jgi:hypothetical protein